MRTPNYVPISLAGGVTQTASIPKSAKVIAVTAGMRGMLLLHYESDQTAGDVYVNRIFYTAYAGNAVLHDQAQLIDVVRVNQPEMGEGAFNVYYVYEVTS